MAANAEEEARAAAFRAAERAREAARRGRAGGLAGNGAARAALTADWEPLRLARQEAREMAPLDDDDAGTEECWR